MNPLAELEPDPDAEPGLPIEWYQSELRACRKRIADLEAILDTVCTWEPTATVATAWKTTPDQTTTGWRMDNQP